MRLRLVLPALLVCATLHATNVTVDCTGAPATFTSINAAMATLDVTGPHTITVIGTCVESVNVSGRDRMTIQGNNASAGIQAPSPSAPFTVNVSSAHGITLKTLTLSGGNRPLFAHNQSELTLLGLTIQGSAGSGLTILDETLVNAGGTNVAQAVLVQNNGIGITIDNASLIGNGFLTVQNNGFTGIDADAATVVLLGQRPGPSGMNVVQNNGGNGVSAHARSKLEFNGKNTFDGNGANGILVFDGATLDLSGPSGFGPIVSNNLRTGVASIFNGAAHVGNATIQNNGSPSDPLSSGVTSETNATARVDTSTITGTAGPGIIVGTGGMLRLTSTSVTGNTAEPIQLRTGGIAELLAGNTLAGSGQNVVTCDTTVILTGEGADVPTDCKKVK
jgi:hypothetical protein